MEVSENFGNFAPELQILIYQYLSPIELLILDLVSKKFKEMAEDNSLWKPHYEREFPDSFHFLQSLERKNKRHRTEGRSWEKFL